MMLCRSLRVSPSQLSFGVVDALKTEGGFAEIALIAVCTELEFLVPAVEFKGIKRKSCPFNSNKNAKFYENWISLFSLELIEIVTAINA